MIIRTFSAIAFVGLHVLICSPAAAQVKPVQATGAQFKQLQWLAGTWRGSGGTYPAFFEQYRVLNDSTILMRALSDSTLSVTTDSSRIEFRNGRILSGSDRPAYVAVELTPTSVRFMREGAASGGHTFTRVSADEWTATLHPAAAGRPPVVYVMRRIRP